MARFKVTIEGAPTTTVEGAKVVSGSEVTTIYDAANNVVMRISNARLIRVVDESAVQEEA